MGTEPTAQVGIMKPQVKGQVVTIFDGQVQTTPLTLEQCRRINPAFWAALARIQARIERKMRASEGLKK